MTFFLCSDVSATVLKGQSDKARERLLAQPPAQIALPAIKAAELLLGAHKSRRPETEPPKVRALMAPLRVDPFTARVAGFTAEDWM
jgi:predicted nucleic acid-binding protein